LPTTVLSRIWGWVSGVFRRAPRQPPLPFSTPVAPAGPSPEPGGLDPHALAADLEEVAKACAEAEEFSRADIAKATGLGVDVAKRRLGVLLDMGWIEREKHGRYRWKGRAFWSG
jgi:hypothetical protein